LLHPGARRHHLAHDFVKGDEPGGVPLPEQHQRQRRRQPLGVGQLGEPALGPAPRHGAAGVEHQHGPQVGFGLELLHREPVGPRQHLPIQVPKLVAGLVRPVLGELDRESPKGRAMETGQESFHYAPGGELEPTQLRHFPGVEQIETLSCHHVLKTGRVGVVPAVGTAFNSLFCNALYRACLMA
jgi:hypothetical protein